MKCPKCGNDTSFDIHIEETTHLTISIELRDNEVYDITDDRNHETQSSYYREGSNIRCQICNFEGTDVHFGGCVY